MSALKKIHEALEGESTPPSTPPSTTPTIQEVAAYLTTSFGIQPPDKLFIVYCYLKEQRRMTSTYFIGAPNKRAAAQAMRSDGEHGVTAVEDIMTHLNYILEGTTGSMDEVLIGVISDLGAAVTEFKETGAACIEAGT